MKGVDYECMTHDVNHEMHVMHPMHVRKGNWASNWPKNVTFSSTWSIILTHFDMRQNVISMWHIAYKCRKELSLMNTSICIVT